MAKMWRASRAALLALTCLTAIAGGGVFAASPVAFATGTGGPTGGVPASGATATPLGCDAASVATAVSQGGSYQFACSGDIPLLKTLVVPQYVTVSLSAGTNQVTLDGQGKVRVLEVAGTLTLDGVAVDNGLATGATGAPGVDGPDGANGTAGTAGTQGHPAGGDGTEGKDGHTGTGGSDGGDGRGGGLLIDATGVVTLNHVTFAGDMAAGGLGGQGGRGGFGGIGGPGGDGFTFGAPGVDGNGGNGGNGGKGGDGGAGGDGGNGGDAKGGAVYNGGRLSVTGSTFVGDTAAGGKGGDGWLGGRGGAGTPGGRGGISDYSLTSTGGNGGNGGNGGKGGDGGDGGDGGSAFGGAVYNAGVISVLVATTFQSDTADGGEAGPGGSADTSDQIHGGGTGGGGGAGGQTRHLGKPAPSGNGGDGGDGGDGGNSGNGGTAFGGAIYSVQPLSTAGLTFTGDGVGAGGSPECLTAYASLMGADACSPDLGAAGGQPYRLAGDTGGTAGKNGQPGDPGQKGTGGAGGCVDVVVVPPDQLGTCASAVSGGLTFGLPTGKSLAQPVVGQPYNSPPLIQGGKAPYTWTVANGSLPPGLGLSTVTGSVYGTPTAAGTFIATLVVADSSSPPQTAADILTLDVAAATAPAPLSVHLPTASPYATVGVPYTLTPVASGGTQPYTWHIASGALPAGLDLNTVTGAVYGTPTAAGAAGFTIQVRDSSAPALTASIPVSLEVQSQPAVSLLTWSPSPLAPAGSLAGGQTVTAVVYARDAGGSPLPGGTVYLSFSPVQGGGSAAVGGAALTATPRAYTTGISGALAVTYTAPATLPSRGLDTLAAASAAANPSVSATDSYSFAAAPGTPASVAIALSPSTVTVDGAVTVSGVVYDAAGNPIPGAGLAITVGGAGQATTATGSDGTYSVHLKAPGTAGTYPVTVTVVGASPTVTGSGTLTAISPGVSVTGISSGVTSAGGAGTSTPDTAATATGGTGAVTVTGYSGDPGPVPTFSSGGTYFDVSLAAASTFASVAISQCGASAGEELFWLDGTAWNAVSPPAVFDANTGCLTFTVQRSGTFPTVSDLTGTPFAVGRATVSTGAGGAAPVLQPVVAGVDPAGGPAAGGTTVTITGSGFDGARAVDFGTTSAGSFTVDSGTEITALSPAGAGTVDVTVTTPYGVSATGTSDRFTYAQPVSQTAPTAAFSDVPAGYWAFGAIELLSQQGIVNGFPGGAFGPEQPVTRAEFVKMLDLTMGLKPGVGETQFADVPPSAWFAPYVSAAVRAGIVVGISPTTFAPDATVTREQMAAILARALSLTRSVTLHFGDDSRIDAWATSAVGETVAAGYIQGFPDGTFRPLGVTTRAQAAKVLALVWRGRVPTTASTGPPSAGPAGTSGN